MRNRVLRRTSQWIGFFLVLVGVVWAVTQSQAAPQLILLAVLCIIAVNFSLPFTWGAAGLVPVVTVSSLLMMGGETAVSLFLLSFLLAQLIQPLWWPLWESLEIERPSWNTRLTTGLIYLLPLLVCSRIDLSSNNTQLILELSLGYGTIYLLLVMGVWWLAKRPFSHFFPHPAISIAAAGFLSPPFAVLGHLIFLSNRLPAFVLFALGIAVFTILIWLSWQRRFILEQQLTQFTRLNHTQNTWRETFDLPDILAHTHQQTAVLVNCDTFVIYLPQNNPPRFAIYQRQPGDTKGQLPLIHTQTPQLDDFSQWVFTHGNVLEITPQNLHFAAQHNLTPPTPTPTAWLGIPLTTSRQTNGVLVLQRFPPNPPFSQWSREVLLALAGQTSTAIENAHLHREMIQHKLAEQEAELTRMVVHDLRNPLTTLMSTLEFAQQKVAGDGNESPMNHLQSARLVCLDMLDMVDSLLDVARLETGRLVVQAEAMRLPRLAEKVISRLSPLAHQRQITLDFLPPPADLPAVWADEEIMRRVLVNLLDNALKFTPTGGHIFGRFLLEPTTNNRHETGVRCIISDNGPGIPPEYRERIFDRYVQTNHGGAQIRGTGLGLTFCKLAIEAQNGRIWAENEPNGGSRFIFTLPGIPIWEK